MVINYRSGIGLSRAALLLAALTVAALVSISGRCQGVPQGRVFTLPMEYDPRHIPFPIVQVRINGGKPLPFVLDTGCSVAVAVTEPTQRELGLSAATERSNDSVHTNVHYKEVKLDAAKLCAANSVNDIELSSNTGLRAFVLPGKVGGMLEQYKIAGLIGLPVLKPFKVARLDFARKVLILGLFGDLADTVKDAAELPLTLQADGRLHITAQAGPGGSPDGSADMVVDTGSSSTLLSDDLAYLSGFTLIDTSSYANVAGVHQVYSGVLARLDLGRFTETNVDCEIPVGEPNLLGADVLSRYLVTFDIGNNKMYLTRGADYADRIRSRGPESATLVQKDGRLIITFVAAGSPAAQAGVQKGDELRSVNGIAVQEMPAISAHLLLNGYVGDKQTLELLRRGEIVNVSYTVESPATSRTSGPGVKVSMARGGKLLVPDGAGIPGSVHVTMVDPGQSVTITPGTTVISNPTAHPR